MGVWRRGGEGKCKEKGLDGKLCDQKAWQDPPASPSSPVPVPLRKRERDEEQSGKTLKYCDNWLIQVKFQLKLQKRFRWDYIIVRVQHILARGGKTGTS